MLTLSCTGNWQYNALAYSNHIPHVGIAGDLQGKACSLTLVTKFLGM